MNLRPFAISVALSLAGIGLWALDPPMAAKAKPSAPATTAWNRLVDAYFESVFRFHPSQGTAAGFHRYDPELENYSRESVEAEIRESRRFLKRLDTWNPAGLAKSDRLDRDILIHALRAALLDRERFRLWEKDPNYYPGGILGAAFQLAARDSAPAATRLRALLARERRMAAALKAARRNLKHPPRIYTEIAIQQMPGMVAFFQKDVPEAFATVKDAQLQADFARANGAVIQALGEYERWLREELLPVSDGDFRIGAEIFSAKLAAEEMVDTPLPRLLEVGYADLKRNQEALARTAALIDAAKPVREVLKDLARSHPTADGLLQSFRDTLGGLRAFIEDHHLLTIPSPVLPIVRETPPFSRATTMASMDTPGPFEKATEAFFNVTLPEPTWPQAQTENYLESYSRGVVHATATHEAFPGHYVQFLWIKQAPSKIRKLLGSGTNAEGWAHYTEQMMLDEGYGGGSPELRLGQLQEALLRNARFIVGIAMHTGQMSLEEAKTFFVKEGYQTQAIAEMEAKRGTSDPTYLIYTLGKLQILKLREDYRQLRGDAFSLREFHDRFLQLGCPPIAIIRQEMLGESGDTL